MGTLVRAAVAFVVLHGVTAKAEAQIVNAQGSKRDAIELASGPTYPGAVVSATDPGSGITVSIDRDGTSVTARSATGIVLWHVDVLKETGRPSVGLPVVRHIEVTVHGVLLVIGKHRFIQVDLTSGKTRFVGED